MTTTAYPFVGQSTTEPQYQQLFTELQDDGIFASRGDTALQPTGSNGQVTITPGTAYIRGHVFDSTENIVLTPSVPTAARADVVLLRLDRNSLTITAIIAEGAGTAAPDLVQTDDGIYEFPLAYITTNPNGAITVNDVRTFVSNRVGCWDTASRPSAPRVSQLGYNVTSLAFEFWDGAQWRPITGSWDTLAGKPSSYPPAEHTHGARLLQAVNYTYAQRTADNTKTGQTATVNAPAGAIIVAHFVGSQSNMQGTTNSQVGLDIVGNAAVVTRTAAGIQSVTPTASPSIQVPYTSKVAFVAKSDGPVTLTLTQVLPSGGQADWVGVLDVEVIPQPTGAVNL